VKHAARIGFSMLLAATCAQAQSGTELVLHNETRLEASAPNGAIAIIAGKGIERTYEWDGCSLAANMTQRSYRWYGSLGIYDPAGQGFLGRLFDKSCNGISRTVVQEGQIHFADIESAQEWIQRRPKAWTTVWTNDGLLVSWGTSPARVQINVDLWLICINGQRPTQLKGATDKAIKLIHKGDSRQAVHECAQVSSQVIAETQKVLREDWKKIDDWKSRDKTP
jgi:hypothetical protein